MRNSLRARRVALFAMTACMLTGSLVYGRGAQDRSNTIALDLDDIGGVVTSAKGPEAGVWVIAETTDLPTKFTRIVVTDDRGRYVVPDLPRGIYTVWVRGYGLVDSEPVQAAPGMPLNLQAVVAPDARSAAAVYPANYWFSLLQFPPKSDFPGTGPNGNGIARRFQTQFQWMMQAKTCLQCHQLGTKATREFPLTLRTSQRGEDRFDHVGAWDRRVQSGQSGFDMNGAFNALGRQRALKVFADWTERIEEGEVPAHAPPRPTGVERNLVITQWDWGTSTGYVHDEIATDKRNPTLYANGPVFGAGTGNDTIVWVDPVEHRSYEVKVPIRDVRTWDGRFPMRMPAPSPYWGSELVIDAPATPHNPMLDHKGRLWVTSFIRDPTNQPDFCRPGSTNAFTQYFPVGRSRSQVVMYDPKTQQMTMIDTCFGTHHLEFGFDNEHTLFFSNPAGSEIGWINTTRFDQTKDAEASQGWCPAVLDTNGDGRITEWVEPDAPLDPTKDKRIAGRSYGFNVNPVDNSVWAAPGGTDVRTIVRWERGDDPPRSCKAEVFEPPMDREIAGARGLDFDTNGVAWVAFVMSGHLASFDRRNCKVLNGPTATGTHCPEGWTIYRVPGPNFTGTDLSADWSGYTVFVDQFDTLGLGKNVPMVQALNSDSLLALLPQTGEWVRLRVPYPLAFFPRGQDGRIDDPNGGWKGRGIWSNYAQHAPWHIEGPKGTVEKPVGKLVKFQLRPDPLAK